MGEAVESEEMSPKWFDFDAIPFKQMWDDDKIWLPLVLEGKKINASFVFGNDNAKVTDHSIEEL